MAKASIVIPVLNRWEQTRRCLEAIHNSVNIVIPEIIVIDHGSTDATAESLSKDFPNVRHIIADPELWWAGAANLGIKTAIENNAERIILLNNDCYVHPETIAVLLAHSKTNPNSVIAPVQVQLGSNKSVIRVTTCFLLGFPTIIYPPFLIPKNSDNNLIETSLIIGGRGVVIPTSIIKKVGLMAEDALPHYGADHDFYLRCRYLHIPLYIALDSKIEVDNSHSSSASDLQSMTLHDFKLSLTNRRSHRNFHDITALFKRHYPIRQLYWIGAALNLVRYFSIFLWHRTIGIFSSK